MTDDVKDDDKPDWEVAAERAVADALKHADIDKERGTIVIDDETFDDLNALRVHLIVVAESAWVDSAPSREFDEFVGECDSDTIVDEALEEVDIDEEFFRKE